MSPTCAACMQPLAPREQFVIGGTEVFHRACLARADQSVGTRRQLALVEFERRLAATEDRVTKSQRLMTEAQDQWLAQLATMKTRHLEILRGARAAAGAEARRAEQNFELYVSSGLEVTRLAAQVRALEAEVARLKTLAAPVEAPTRSGQDDTEIRFSLLELDKD